MLGGRARGRGHAPGTLKIIRKRVVRKVLDTIDDAWDAQLSPPMWGPIVITYFIRPFSYSYKWLFKEAKLNNYWQ